MTTSTVLGWVACRGTGVRQDPLSKTRPNFRRLMSDAYAFEQPAASTIWRTPRKSHRLLARVDDVAAVCADVLHALRRGADRLDRRLDRLRCTGAISLSCPSPRAKTMTLPTRRATHCVSTSTGGHSAAILPASCCARTRKTALWCGAATATPHVRSSHQCAAGD